MQKVDNIGLQITVERIADAQGWDAVIAPWREFVARPGVKSGFWCMPDVLHAFELRSGSGELLLATVQSADGQLAVLPFRLEQRPVPIFIGLCSVGRIEAATARLFDFEFPVMEGQDRVKILSMVSAHLGETVGCDLVLGQNCAVQTDANGDKGAVWRNVQTTYLAELPDTFDKFLRRMSSKSRQTLKRKVRKAEQEADGLQLRSFTEPDQMAALCETLEGIWKASWHGRLGRQRPPGLEVLQRLAEQELVRGYVLMNGAGTPLATVLGYLQEGIYYDEAPAYDEKWSKLSPGLVLNYFIVEDLIQNSAATKIDFGFGYNQYKQVLGNLEIERGNLWIALSKRGQRILAVMCACDSIYKAGKQLLSIGGLDRKVKHWMQGKRKGDQA